MTEPKTESSEGGIGTRAAATTEEDALTLFLAVSTELDATDLCVVKCVVDLGECVITCGISRGVDAIGDSTLSVFVSEIVEGDFCTGDENVLTDESEACGAIC